MTDLKTKIVNIFKRDQLASLATISPDGKPWVRYVTLIAVPDFPLIFCTDINSRKIRDIRQNPEVHLTCGELRPPDESVYLQIQAKAHVSTDAGEKKDCWNPAWIRYFTGPDDPNYTIVQVEPYYIEFLGPESHFPQIWEKK